VLSPVNAKVSKKRFGSSFGSNRQISQKGYCQMAGKTAAEEASTFEPAYDVAISFLAEDQQIAQALVDQLEASGLKIFFFPHNQEELAGTNGMETMRAPFLESRVNVVLFKQPWGKTPWTRVEDAAISERCFKGGWSSLMFVQLDKTSRLPKWLPATHVRFAMEDYGIDQLVGAIKLRVQEQGGTVVPLDAMSEPKRVRREAEFLAEREAMMSSRQWIEDTVHRNLRETMDEIVQLAKEANAPGFQITGAADGTACVLRSGFVSIGVGWKQPIFNRVSDSGKDECYLRVAEFSGAVTLPKERLMVWEQPRLIKEHRFKVDVARSPPRVDDCSGSSIRPEAILGQRAAAPPEEAEDVHQLSEPAVHSLLLLNQRSDGGVSPHGRNNGSADCLLGAPDLVLLARKPVPQGLVSAAGDRQVVLTLRHVACGLFYGGEVAGRFAQSHRSHMRRLVGLRLLQSALGCVKFIRCAEHNFLRVLRGLLHVLDVAEGLGLRLATR
jgi:hypothetical protein